MDLDDFPTVVVGGGGGWDQDAVAIVVGRGGAGVGIEASRVLLTAAEAVPEIDSGGTTTPKEGVGGVATEEDMDVPVPVGMKDVMDFPVKVVLVVVGGAVGTGTGIDVPFFGTAEGRFPVVEGFVVGRIHRNGKPGNEGGLLSRLPPPVLDMIDDDGPFQWIEWVPVGGYPRRRHESKQPRSEAIITAPCLYPPKPGVSRALFGSVWKDILRRVVASSRTSRTSFPMYAYHM